MAALQSVAVLFQVLLIGMVTSYSSTIANQILVGAGRVPTVAIALVAVRSSTWTLSLSDPSIRPGRVAVATRAWPRRLSISSRCRCSCRSSSGCRRSS